MSSPLALPRPSARAAWAALTAAALLLLAATSAQAQAQAPARPGAAAGEPRIERIVVEDDGTRIEELRVRGQTQRIVVQSKTPGARPYEILPPEPGRDPSQPQERRSAGQRVWHVLSF